VTLLDGRATHGDGDDVVTPVAADPIGARLLQAAAEVFGEQGFAGTRVAEIARRAGLTTGAIYSRYRGKAELLADAIDASSTDELDALFSDHRFEGRMEDILTVAGSHLVDEHNAAAESGLLLEAFVAARHEPEVADLLAHQLHGRRDRLAAVVESAKAGGGIDPDLDTDSLVTFCHALGLGFLLLQVVDTPMPAGEEWQALIARLVAAAGRRADDSNSHHEPGTKGS
jgi:AcrR family transcriptional regulator